ncbi:MAG TPA: MFS transporter [Caulobacteraceae bacterium]|nr:MFS transporter [Caulobacteraceae bacterium]
MADTAALAAAADPHPPSLVGAGRRRYVLVLLMIAYTLSFLDRQMLSILVEPIEKDLHISDSAMGLLTGPIFVIFYTFLGVPIAWIADRWSRPLIIAFALTVWSGFTALCGAATSFPILGFARLGVGFGEAGCNPSSHSFIADMSTPAQRASGLSFYSLGVPIGTLLGLGVGGVIADLGPHGWRMAFLVAAAPGVALAAIIALSVRDVRPNAPALRIVQAFIEPFRDLVETMKALSGKPSFWLVAVGSGFSAFVGYAQLFFNASFFLRCHPAEVAAIAATLGLKSKTFLGPALGLMTGVGGLSGTLIGGWVADRAVSRDRRMFATVPALAALGVMPLMYATYLVPQALPGILLVLIPSVGSTIWYGAVYSTAQSVVEPRRRATAAALLLLILNLIGLGGGPTFLGFASDYFAKVQHLGPAEGLRRALIVTSTFSLLTGLFFWLARARVREDVVS